MTDTEAEARVRELATALADAMIVLARATSTTSPTTERLLSVAEAALSMGVGRSFAYQEIAAGHLRTLKVGRRRLVPAAAINDWVAAQHVGGVSDGR